jgi:hypothetical protein
MKTVILKGRERVGCPLRIPNCFGINRIRTFDAVVRETFARQRFSALLLMGFSLLGFGLRTKMASVREIFPRKIAALGGRKEGSL